MKHLSLFKNMALACGTLAAAVTFSSCSGVISPNAAADKLGASADVTVFSHNDVNNPNNRNCREAGPLPEQTGRALMAWLRNSTIKTFSYAYPQYYVAMQNPKTGRPSTWGICSDGQGNLVGVLIPRDGVMAWDLPAVGEYRMYVCNTDDRKALSDVIMTTLADAGYDTYRIDSRKAIGLTQQRYLISKPLSDEAQKRYDELKKQEEASQKSKAEGEEAADIPPAEETPAADAPAEESTTDDAADSGDDSMDDGFDELGF